MRRMFLLLIVSVCLGPIPARSQTLALSTNVIDYACLGTLNMESSYAVGQHWSLSVSARYNPFTYLKGDVERQFQYRQQSYALGTRYWLWHSFSGWWTGCKVRYQEYNVGGLLSREAEEGDRMGLGLAAGYTYMLSKHFNLEFGLGLWSGMAWYRRYSCPVCGLTTASGRKWFLLPDDVMLSLAYVF